MYRFSTLFFIFVMLSASACNMASDDETTTSSDDDIIVIGPDGGRVFDEGSGAYVAVRPETFLAVTEIEINSLAVDVPLEVQASVVIEVKPLGRTLRQPAVVVIPYSGGGFNPADLQIYWSSDPNAPLGSWQALASSVNQTQNVVSAQIDQFGYFVVGIAGNLDSESENDTTTVTDTATATDTGTATASTTTGTDTASDTVADTGDTGADTDSATASGAIIDHCASMPCGENGTCTNRESSYSCACNQGYAGTNCDQCDDNYQDNDGDGICTAGCALLGMDCGANGVCDDASGVPVCDCDTGYSGASCAECAAGFQDNDSNGTCTVGCASGSFNCGVNSSCDDSSGTAICACTTAATGADCSVCATGFQDNDNNGTCTESCALAGLACGPNGACNDSAGTAVCTCSVGYTGATCSECATGYQDNDNDDVCLPTCASLGWTCSGNGDCSDLSGEAVCDCDLGYSSDGAGGCNLSGNICPNAIEISAITLPVSGAVTGTTIDAGSIYTASCGGTAGSNEMIYAFTLAAPASVTFSTEGSVFDTVLHLRSDCDDPASEIACNDNTVGSASYIEAVLLPGNYNLFVDGYGTGTTGGDYVLTYTIEPEDPCDPNPCAVQGQTTCVVDFPGYVCECDFGWIPDGFGGCFLDTDEGNTCATALALPASPLPISGSVTGVTTSSGYDHVASCGGGAESEEMIYTFTVAEEVWAVFSTEGSSFDTVLHIRSDCNDFASELACNDDMQSFVYQSYIELMLPPGTYSVFVDGYGGSTFGESGAYTLSYSLVAEDPCLANPCGPNAISCTPSNDWLSFTCECEVGYVPDSLTGECILYVGPVESTCANPSILPIISVPGSASVTGSSDGAGANYNGSCGGSGNEVVYSFTVTETVNAAFSTEGSDYDTVLYVRSDCANSSTASQLGCNDDSGTLQSYLELTLTQGTYSVFVDAYSTGSYGDYTLTYTLSAP